ARAARHRRLRGAADAADGTRRACGAGASAVRVITVPEGKLLLKFDNHSDWVFARTWTLPDAKEFGQAGKPGETSNRVGVFEGGEHIVTTGRDRAVKLIVAKNGQFVDDINTFTSSYHCLVRHPKL